MLPPLLLLLKYNDEITVSSEGNQIKRVSGCDGGVEVKLVGDATLTYCSIKLLEACIKCILFCYLMLLLSLRCILYVG